MEEQTEESESPDTDTDVSTSVTTADGETEAPHAAAEYTVTAVLRVDGAEAADPKNNDVVTLELPEGKVAAGSSFTFKASIQTEKAETYEFTKIAYTMEDREVDCTSTWESRGNQRTISNVTGDVTITVEAEKKVFPKITFVNPANLQAVTAVKINDRAVDMALPAAGGQWELEAPENAKVSFQLTAADDCRIDRVVYEYPTTGRQGSLTAVSGVYTIEKLMGDIRLTVEASLDPAKNYGFSFAMAKGSEYSAAMQVELPAGKEDLDGASLSGTVYQEGDAAAYTRNGEIVVSFQVRDGFSVRQVTADGKTITGNEGKYTIPLTKGQVVQIVAETEVQGILDKEAKLVFSVSGNSLSLKSVKGDSTTLTSDGSWQWQGNGFYTFSKNMKKLFVEVESSDANRRPVFRYDQFRDSEEGEAYWHTVTSVFEEPVSVREAGGKWIYTYCMSAQKVTALCDIYYEREYNYYKRDFWIYEEAVDSKYTYRFAGADNNSLRNVNVSIDGRTVGDIERFSREVSGGTEVSVRIWPKDGYTLDGVTYKVGGSEKSAAVKKNAAEFTMKITADTVVTIDASGILTGQPLMAVGTDGTETETALAKNGYQVSYGGKYAVRIAEGHSEPQAYAKITAVMLKKGNAEVQPADDILEVTDSGTRVVVDLSKAAADTIAGQTLKLTLTAGGENFVYTLQASKKIAKAADITVQAGIKQPVGTTKYYKVSTKGEFDRLGVRVENDSEQKVIAGAALENGQLKVTTAQTAETVDKTKNVKIRIYSAEDETVYKDIAVETTSLLPAGKPAVKLKSATDIDLTFTLTAATDEAADGAVYYKVTAKQTAGQTGISDKLKTEAAACFRKTGKSQDVTLNVAKDGASYGDGGACKFDVSVSLVHTKAAVMADGKAVEETADIASDNVIETGSAGQTYTSGNKPFATQNPAWETKLKLKKGTSTVYTGQGEVQIAEAQFSAATTYRVFDPENTAADVTANLKDGEALRLRVTPQGVIYAEAEPAARLGKHTIRVTAPTKAGMAASDTTIAVTVVRGIQTLGVSVPATSFYKPLKKAATLKATVVYNGDDTGKDKNLQPKTKKVQWAVVAVEADGAGGYQAKKENDTDVIFSDKVKVKNGSVTVAKDYEIAEDDEKNTFMIRVTVNNTGKTKIGSDSAVGYSAPITITNEGLALSRLQIGSYQIYGSTYTSRASEIDGQKLTVLDANGKAIAWNDLTVQSSKPKDVEIKVNADGNRYLKVHKANATVKLTAAANDGSRQKLQVTLKLRFDGITISPYESGDKMDLGVRFYALQPAQNAGEETAVETAGGAAILADEINTIVDPNAAVTRSASYAGTTRLRAEVVALTTEYVYDGYNEETYESIYKPGATTARPADFVDYKLTVVKGGTKTAQNGSQVDLTAKEKTVTVKLTGKAVESKYDSTKRKYVDTITNIEKTYTLTNTDVEETVKGVTAKALGNLHQTGTQAEQTAQIQLTIPNAAAEKLNTGKKVAKVDLDWTKLNAKNSESLYRFMAHLHPSAKVCEITELVPTADKTAQTAVITLGFDADMQLAQSSYALKVTVGTTAETDGKAVFTPAAAAAAVTVKVDKTKKFTYKPVTAYTMQAKAGDAVELTGTASIPNADYTVIYTRTDDAGQDDRTLGLRNANFAGKANDFTKYFELNGKELRLKPSLTADDLTHLSDKANQNDLTGYLVYRADTDKTYYEKSTGTGINTVKITVKLKAN
ncbi:MAG: hypothetical protein NC302_08850 [Bacteroidales bacterium]|nr:hypothetical protein [Bacteroidales bacterium]MCM1414876.1 hypothetical protein [bacterium]MCM1424073.1 hypothetical protein [bacterium]